MAPHINAGVAVADIKECVRCGVRQVLLADLQSSWLEVGMNLHCQHASFPSLHQHPYIHVVVEGLSWMGMTFAVVFLHLMMAPNMAVLLADPFHDCHCWLICVPLLLYCWIPLVMFHHDAALSSSTWNARRRGGSELDRGRVSIENVDKRLLRETNKQKRVRL